MVPAPEEATPEGDVAQGRRALGRGDLRGAAAALGRAFEATAADDHVARAAILALVSVVAIEGGDLPAGARAAGEAVAACASTTDGEARALTLTAAARVAVALDDGATAARLLAAARREGSPPELDRVAGALASVGIGPPDVPAGEALSAGDALALAEARCDLAG